MLAGPGGCLRENACQDGLPPDLASKQSVGSGVPWVQSAIPFGVLSHAETINKMSAMASESGIAIHMTLICFFQALLSLLLQWAENMECLDAWHHEKGNCLRGRLSIWNYRSLYNLYQSNESDKWLCGVIASHPRG